MNAVEIEEAVSQLAEQPFDAAEFPFAFLAAFGNKETTIRRLRSGNNNASDVPGGVLQRSNIHMAVCAEGAVAATLAALRDSPRTAANKVRFVLATDGRDFQAEDLTSGETVACDYPQFADHFGFFLPLAGITTVKQIRESAFDIRATGRLNKLYVQLLKDNPDWGAAERRHDMNHFMARLIFCFFAEDTGIFFSEGLFTETVRQMSDASNTHEVIEAIFRAMNTPTKHEGQPDARYRRAAGTPRWADVFPYVNGGLFSGSLEVPRFSRIAKGYLLHIGSLDWKQINPDIFGSMIQAVADDEERGELGMHYTSVPNILKVLNPLFLDDLREQLEAAGDNARALLNLRKRLARIRVFDPACGSGNFLVIAYKEMRQIEAETNRRRGEADRRSEIPLTNFRGIEIRDFAAEIARLALIIAEYQADVLYRGQKEALAEFLPLNAENWIVCDNALRLDWLSVCRPTGIEVRHHADDLFETPLDQTKINFDNEGGEVYLCGNPPYKGSQSQTAEQKGDLVQAFVGTPVPTGAADYVLGWFAKACSYVRSTGAVFAFVATNSIHQGRQVARFWPALLAEDLEIRFAEPSFRWANLASKKATVTVSIIGVSRASNTKKRLVDDGLSKVVGFIGPYLVPDQDAVVDERRTPLSPLPAMTFGNMPNDDGELILSPHDARAAVSEHMVSPDWVRPFWGTSELTRGVPRYCLWLRSAEVWCGNEFVDMRVERVRLARSKSTRKTTVGLATTPYLFGEVRQSGSERPIIVGGVSSEIREYLPVDMLRRGAIVSNLAFLIAEPEAWNLSVIASRLHLVWVSTVCGKLETRYRYSNTLGWNTFPVPTLTDQNKADLTRCAKDILLAREAHWPATIADLYDPDEMPEDLRHAHDRNDEVLERIYIGRRFRNDTERLEKLFELYTKMTAAEAKTKGAA